MFNYINFVNNYYLKHLTIEQLLNYNTYIVEQLFNCEVINMCEHHDHCNEHEHENHKLTIIRVSAAIIIFSAGMVLHLSGLQKFLVFFAAYMLAGGDVLLTALKNILKGDMFDENFLMGVATLGAFAIKEYPEAVMVMILYQIGEFLQHKAVEKSRSSIAELMDIRPDYANIEENGSLIKKSPESINIGDVIVVKTGEKIPLDGTVTEGCATVDTSALTGESVPRKIKEGDSAISGCINTNGLVKIRVEKEFGESTVSKILKLVENASARKAKAENFITKFARYYTPVVVLGALLLAVLPPIVTGWTMANFTLWLQRALTFLVISCPCALVISVPLSFFAGIGGASRNGILIKGSSYLEALSKPYAVVFDKTGTLTKGTFNVTNIVPKEGISKEQLLEYAAYAENYSNHPIALSLKSAYGQHIDSNTITEVEEIAGNGIKANVKGTDVLAGNDKLMNRFNLQYEQAKESGTIVYVAIKLNNNWTYTGYIVISDEVKDDSQKAITALKKLTKQTVMLTGDSASTAKYIAEKLGLDKYYAQLLPADKVTKIEEIISQKEKGQTVIFTGDGINDAPVLTRADIGIAMGALGSDAAIEAADVVIMDDKPSKIPTAIKIAQTTMSIVRQNIAFAIGIKILFLILGAFGFITMWGAVFADVGVTLIAVLNSLRALRPNIR